MLGKQLVAIEEKSTVFHWHLLFKLDTAVYLKVEDNEKYFKSHHLMTSSNIIILWLLYGCCLVYNS